MRDVCVSLVSFLSFPPSCVCVFVYIVYSMEIVSPPSKSNDFFSITVGN